MSAAAHRRRRRLFSAALRLRLEPLLLVVERARTEGRRVAAVHVGRGGGGMAGPAVVYHVGLPGGP